MDHLKQSFGGTREALSWVLICVLGLFLTTNAFAQERYASLEVEGAEETNPTKTIIQPSENLPVSLSQVISLQLEEETLEGALRHITEKVDLDFVYSSQKVTVGKKITLTRDQISVRRALTEVLRDTDLQFLALPSGKLVLIDQREKKVQKGRLETGPRPSMEINRLVSARANQARESVQTGEVAGTVTDAETGDPLPGVNVVVVGTQQGAATDVEGRYRITGLEPGTYSVQASFVGYQEDVQEGIEVQADETATVDFSLAPAATGLEEVIVTGYGGEQQRGDVTAAISQISSQELEDANVSSFDQALQGLSSGVEVTSAGSPGQGAIVRIRGLATTNNNDPLYVIDGVPTNELEGVSPSDIESIEVLKDASAAAIYGSRASNGVVLVSTKSGQAGERRVTFNSSVGFQNVPENRWLDLLNTDQYVEVNRRLAENTDGVSVPGNIAEGADIPDQNVDWQDAVFQTGLVTDHSFGISGGSETSQYHVSLGYTKEEGAVVESDFERYSLRVNSSFDLGGFDISENISLSHRERNPMRTEEVIGLAQRFPPYLSVRDSDNLGGFNGPDQADGFDDPNPVRIQENGFEQEEVTKILGNVSAEAQITDGLSVRTVLGADVEYGTYDNFVPAFNDGEFQNQDFSEIEENRFTFFQPVSTTTLNFDRTFGSHTINNVAGYEYTLTKFNESGGQGRNNVTRNIRVPGSVEEDVVSGTEATDVLHSAFNRINYNYDDKYLIQAAARYDGFSRFGPGQKWGIFPSGSAGWVVSEEPFLSDVSVLSNLKVRGSFGVTGNNQSLDRYEFQSTVSTGFEYPFGGTAQTGSAIVNLANEDLQWETTKMLNVGTDLGFFDQALTFTAEYYRNTTQDILLDISLPGSSGFAGDPRANTGEVETTGFEFTLGYESQNAGDFNWSVDANFSTVENEVTSLGRGNPINGATWQQAEGVSTRIEGGRPIWFFFGWETDRLFQEDDFASDGSLKDGIPNQAGEENDPKPGDIKFVDQDGNGVIDENDRTQIGSPHPDMFYGLTGNVTWKNFNASLTMQGAAGQQILQDFAFWTDGTERINNFRTDVLDAWTPQNTDTDQPRLVAGAGNANDNNRISDRWIEDGDYLRVKRVTLGYQLPLERFNLGSRVQRARVYVQSENLFTLTGYDGYDPEVGARDSATGDASRGIDTGQYVQPRAFRVGVELTF